MMAALEPPISTPQNCASRCAGVQNVSRPIERCHERSQCIPIAADAAPITAHQIYQGTVFIGSDNCVSLNTSDFWYVWIQEGTWRSCALFSFCQPWQACYPLA